MPGLGGYALGLRLGPSATEDLSPEAHARICADLVAMKRTAKLFVLTYTLAGSAVTIHSYKGMNGTGAPYAPDVRTVNGTGDLSLQWSIPVFVDPYDIAFPIRTKDARGTGHGSAALIVNPTAIDGGVRVRTFLHDGTPADGKVTVVGW